MEAMKAKLKPRPADIPQLVDLRMYLERWPDDAATHAYRYTGRPFQSQLKPGASRRNRGGLVGVVTSAIKLVRRSDASLDGLGLERRTVYK
jgi:hypothetical protein